MVLTATMVFTAFLAVAIIAAAFPDAYGQGQTACSNENRTRNLNQCLTAIRFRALDRVNSRYGQAFFNRCPPEVRFGINCFEPDPITEPKSLAQITFRVDNPDLSGLDRFLRIRYNSLAGSYFGCDHTYTYPNTKYFFIDPLSNTAYPSWDLRQDPRTRWDYSEGEIFTLISVDPNWTTKGVVANIRGNDFSTALIMYDYDGHRNWQNAPRPSAWILYRQTRRVFLERIPSSGFNVTDFAERNQLQGPVAFSWVNALYDPFTAGMFPWGENCASVVQDEFRQSFVSSYLATIMPELSEFDLSVFVRVRYTTTPATFNCGDYFVNRPSEDFYIDSVDPESNILDATSLRLDARRSFTFSMNKLYSSPRDFDGKLHTLMLINARNGIYDGMVINIPGNNVTIEGLESSVGTVLPGYQPPSPTEAEGTQGYVFMLFEQAARLPTTTNPTPYLADNSEFTNLRSFLSDHRLRLVGVARMTVAFTEYSRCTRSTPQATADCVN